MQATLDADLREIHAVAAWPGLNQLEHQEIHDGYRLVRKRKERWI